MEWTTSSNELTISTGYTLSSPQHSIGPSRYTTFLAGVIIIAEEVILIGWCKICWTFIEAKEYLEWALMTTNENKAVS